jgi:glyoxylate reductase
LFVRIGDNLGMTTRAEPMSGKIAVACSRPLPGEFVLDGIDPARVSVRYGPERGFASRAEGLAFFKGADAVVTWVSDRVDGEFLDAIGPQVRIVANFAVGTDNIDIAACRARGIAVSNTPDAVTDGTADCAVMLMLAAARHLVRGDRFARSGEWAQTGILGPRDFLGMPVSGRTLVIVGAGRIGLATAQRMQGWGMKVLYVARRAKPEFERPPMCAERVELDEGMRRGDFISIHTPLTPETRGLIDAQRLALCKPTAVLVNTARGPVVDEGALAAALREGRIYAAGLDVFEKEPAVHPDLVGLANVVMTPHIGSANLASRMEMTRLCGANISAVARGLPPVTPVG